MLVYRVILGINLMLHSIMVFLIIKFLFLYLGTPGGGLGVLGRFFLVTTIIILGKLKPPSIVFVPHYVRYKHSHGFNSNVYNHCIPNVVHFNTPILKAIRSYSTDIVAEYD